MGDSIEQCADLLGQGKLTDGVDGIQALLGEWLQDGLRPSCSLVLDHASNHLREYGVDRTEYILLTLHSLNEGRQVDTPLERAAAVLGAGEVVQGKNEA